MKESFVSCRNETSAYYNRYTGTVTYGYIFTAVSFLEEHPNCGGIDHGADCITRTGTRRIIVRIGALVML